MFSWWRLLLIFFIRRTFSSWHFFLLFILFFLFVFLNNKAKLITLFAFGFGTSLHNQLNSFNFFLLRLCLWYIVKTLNIIAFIVVNILLKTASFNTHSLKFNSLFKYLIITAISQSFKSKLYYLVGIFLTEDSLSLSLELPIFIIYIKTIN